eukprot:2188532-Rhodomonas_salina.2
MDHTPHLTQLDRVSQKSDSGVCVFRRVTANDLERARLLESIEKMKKNPAKALASSGTSLPWPILCSMPLLRYNSTRSLHAHTTLPMCYMHLLQYDSTHLQDVPTASRAVAVANSDSAVPRPSLGAPRQRAQSRRQVGVRVKRQVTGRPLDALLDRRTGGSKWGRQAG